MFMLLRNARYGHEIPFAVRECARAGGGVLIGVSVDGLCKQKYSGTLLKGGSARGGGAKGGSAGPNEKSKGFSGMHWKVPLKCN